MAQAYAALGANEAALAWLTRSVDARETRASWVIDEGRERRVGRRDLRRDAFRRPRIGAVLVRS
jgi:hypothetical protein